MGDYFYCEINMKCARSLHFILLLNDSIFRELKKKLASEKFLKFTNYFFSTGTPAPSKLDDGILVTHF